ncbi:MAG TPA: hypothetical protein VF856_12690, partial [Gemmatimonadaceae bacterium]
NQIVASSGITLAPVGTVFAIDVADAVGLLTWPDAASLPGTMGVVRAPVARAASLGVVTTAFWSLTDVGDAEAEVRIGTHGAAGSTGIFQAGRIRMNAGMARWPITAAVQTACRDAADRLRSKYAALAAMMTRIAPLSAASMRSGNAL